VSPDISAHFITYPALILYTIATRTRAPVSLSVFGPARPICPIRPALGNAVVPATACAPAPSTPAAGRCSRCRKIPWAVGRTRPYDTAVRPLTGPAMPAALRLALHRRLTETRSAPTPLLPRPPPRVPGSASRRCPSPLGCRSGCVRSGWLLRLRRDRFFLRTWQAACADRLVQSVRQHLQLRRHLRHTPPL